MPIEVQIVNTFIDSATGGNPAGFNFIGLLTQATEDAVSHATGYKSARHHRIAG